MAGIPERFKLCSEDDLDFALPLMNEAGLFITGPAGVGKTYLVGVMANDRLPDLMEVQQVFTGTHESEQPALYQNYVESVGLRWITVPRFLARQRATFNNGNKETEISILDEFGKVRLLVLDDIGAEKATDWTMQSLYILLCDRIDGLLPTIVTSNLTLEEIDQTDPRIASRLGAMELFEYVGPDRRIEG